MNGNPALHENYEQVLRRIASACEAAGRAPGSVQLLAVSKTFPAACVLELAALGQRAFGENYVQEAMDKIAACRDERSGVDEQRLEWHFIGPVQSNKTRPIAEHFDWVHSVDRERIARRFSEQRPGSRAPLQVCVQVNVSGEASKSGVAPGEAVALARLCASLPGLRLRGLTAIPEPTQDTALQRRRFATLRRLGGEIRETFEREGLWREAKDFDTLSMGMSADLEAAVMEGATIVRIGTALFGHRPPKAGDPFGDSSAQADDPFDDRPREPAA